MKPATQHYLIVDQGVVTGRKALGPDLQADGSWSVPPAPANSVLVPMDTYLAASIGDSQQAGTVTPGERGPAEERCARLLARAKRADAALMAAQNRLTTADARLTAAEAAVNTLTAALSDLTVRVAALEAK